MSKTKCVVECALHSCAVAAALIVPRLLFAEPPRGLSIPTGVDEIRVLSQNWAAEDAERFYNLPQGSKLLPYEWLLKLEQPSSSQPFLEPDYIRKFGYLPRTPDARGNPDGLPVGFVRDGDHVGLTCAACHTALIQRERQTWLIDGGPTHANVEAFQKQLVAALSQTTNDGEKFDRFARHILGLDATDAEKAALKAEVLIAVDVRRDYNERNLPSGSATPFGPGRVDAFGAILNEVTSIIAGLPTNSLPANAPVSYPFLWDTPHHDFVQWNGAAENKDIPLLHPLVGTPHVGALGRNAGEVIGVFGQVDASREGSLFHLRGYPSSVNKPNLIEVEELLRRLWSPQWPAAFGAVDEAKRARGEMLFEHSCRACHDRIVREHENRRVFASMQAVGTDQTMASNFATRVAKAGVLQGRKHLITGVRRFGETEPVRDLLTHVVQRVVLRPSSNHELPSFSPDNLVAALPLGHQYRVFAEIRVGDQRIVGAFDRLELLNGRVREAFSVDPLGLKTTAGLLRQQVNVLDGATHFLGPGGRRILFSDLPDVREEPTRAGTELSFSRPARVEFAYKGRPLNGIWATAPFLHNGSVPNLEELLKPPAQRMPRFQVGSREFDVDRVGFRTDLGEFQFDTTLPGNSNSGHEYDREFTPGERADLIEYMKSL